MSARRIGSLKVAAIGLGCMGMSENYGERDDVESAATLDLAVELGVDLFDSSDTYGHGHNEELLAAMLKRHGGGRHLMVATKFGIVREPGVYARRIDNAADYIRACCERSLKRLGLETIDLYYVHRIDAGTPIEQTVGVLADLVREGKIREIGLCEPAAATLRRAQSVHPIAAVQSEYSLWTRDPEVNGILDVCREFGISFVAYCPMGRGFLTGAYSKESSFGEGDMRKALPRFQGEYLDRNMCLVETLITFAEEKGCTPAQLALGWLLNKEPFVVPIPGTRKRKHLGENIGAAPLVLSEAEMKKLDQAVPIGAAVGERYTAEGMKGIYA